MTRSSVGITCGVTRLWSRTRLSSLALACLAGLALFTAACGGSPSGSAGGTTSTSDQPTSTARSETAAVVAAYRASQTAFQQAVDNADPNLPALAQTMTGDQLDSVRRTLTSDKLNGIVGRGTVQLNPKVSYVHGNQALVLDCAFDSSELVYVATGKPVPPVTPAEHVAIRSQLNQMSPGVWKVADQHTSGGACPAGY
jgi:hypothetical protein